jgi:hypothetical protein
MFRVVKKTSKAIIRMMVNLNYAQRTGLAAALAFNELFAQTSAQ